MKKIPVLMVVTKTEVFSLPNAIDHEEIIEHYNLKETNVRGEITFVRIQYVPVNNDRKAPPSKWYFGHRQDLLPKWYDKEVINRRAKSYLGEIIKQRK